MPAGTLVEIAPGQSVLAAIMFSDVVGYSKRMGQDEIGTLALLQRDMALLTDLTIQHDGQVLKSVGDGLMIFFSSAVQAVRCAQAFQNEVTSGSATRSPAENLQHRIGIHLGDIFVQGTDVMGDGVNIASRLQGEAEPGGICISQTVYDVVRNRLALSVTSLGARELKNIRQSIPIYRILVEANGGAAALEGRVPRTKRTAPKRQIAALAGLLLLGGLGSWWSFGRAPSVAPAKVSASETQPLSSAVTGEFLKSYQFAKLLDQSMPQERRRLVQKALEFHSGMVRTLHRLNRDGHPLQHEFAGRKLSILDAFPERLIVQQDGERREIAWSQFSPEEMVDLALELHGELPRNPLVRKQALENLRGFTDLYDLPSPDLRGVLAEMPRPGLLVPR